MQQLELPIFHIIRPVLSCAFIGNLGVAVSTVPIHSIQLDIRVACELHDDQTPMVSLYRRRCQY